MIGNGYADVKSVHGNTVVWNQECFVKDVTTASYVTNDLPSGHVLYVSCIVHKGSTPGCIFINLTSDRTIIRTDTISAGYYSKLYTNTGASSNVMVNFTYAQEGDWIESLCIIDLTKMFGSGNEPSLNEFERLFPNEYYPYCEGRLVSLGGYKIKWNQLVQNGNFEDGTTGWNPMYGTISVSSNRLSYTLTTSHEAARIDRPFTPIILHKYYVSCTYKSSTSTTTSIGIGSSLGSNKTISANTRTVVSYIITPTDDGINKIYFYCNRNGNLSVGDVVTYENLMCIDLTEMFGPGSEPTAEEFEAMFGTEYHPYDEGTEMNVMEKFGTSDELGVKSTGFNLWDEQWSAYNVTSFIRCLPNTTYCLGGTNTNSAWHTVTYYNETKEEIGKLEYSIAFYNVYPTFALFTTPSDCQYFQILFNPHSNINESNYNHDVCINLSDPNKNGTYLPYQTSTQDLSWIYDLEYTPEGSETSEKLFPYGLLSAGSVHDEVTEIKAIKRVGVVDLGSLNWSPTMTSHVFLSSNITGLKTNTSVSGLNAKFLNVKYEGRIGGRYSSDLPNLFISNNLNGSTTIIIRDDNYSSNEDFKSAVYRNILYYELATPIEILINPQKTLGYNVQSGGTEELLPTNLPSTGPTNAPIRLSVTYPLDAVGTLVNLPKNYISVESMDDFTSALSQTLGLTITKEWQSNNNKWHFTVTQNSQL